MGFSEAVAWWEEWQLRILVLCSLFLQFFLFSAAFLRKRCIPSWFRFLIWLAYLGGDAVAIYALATLFSRHRAQEWVSAHHESTAVQVLWAPVLLLHLGGGPHSITAYNIEDNELWRRHVLTALSQVAVALYVFSKLWSGDERILAAAIPLFFVGILKCVLKPWDLKRVSIGSLVDSCASEENGEIISSLDEYIRAAAEYFQADCQDEPTNVDAGEPLMKPYGLFVDLAPPYSARLGCLKLIGHYPDEAHCLLQYDLSATLDRFYTKDTLYFRKYMGSNRFAHFLSFLAILSMLWAFMVMASHKHGAKAYNRVDVEITLYLLILTALLENIAPLGMIMSKYNTVLIKWLDTWPDQVAQYDLIWYLARNQRHRTLRKVATLLVCKDYLDQLWCMKPCNSSSSSSITKLVHGHIRDGWRQINDITSYSRFNDNRGQRTLRRERRLGSLGWSLRRPFDESVLLWHLATNFCLHRMDTSPAAHQEADAYQATSCRSKEISNYMVYLLFVNPEMLIPGARRSLFRAAHRKLKDIAAPLLGEQLPGERELTEGIMDKLRGIMDKLRVDAEGSGVVHDAWRIARELNDLQDEGRIWEVVQGVWVEMLCFSAGRCRAYLHAKSLGKGGEFLSYIWLLQLHMGMVGFSRKLFTTLTIN